MNFDCFNNCVQHPPMMESIAISSGAFRRIFAGILDSKNAFKIYLCCLFFIAITYT